MLFVIVIRNRYWSRTRKIVNLVFYAHRYREVVSKIRYELTNHAEKYRRLQSCRYLVLSRIYSQLAVNKTAVPYFALNSTSIIGQRAPLKHVDLIETCSEEKFLKEFRMTRDEVKGSA